MFAWWRSVTLTPAVTTHFVYPVIVTKKKTTAQAAEDLVMKATGRLLRDAQSYELTPTVPDPFWLTTEKPGTLHLADPELVRYYTDLNNQPRLPARQTTMCGREAFTLTHVSEETGIGLTELERLPGCRSCQAEVDRRAEA